MANNNSDGTPDWIYDIVPAKQIEEMESTAEHVEYNLKNGVNIVLSASNDSELGFAVRTLKEKMEAC